VSNASQLLNNSESINSRTEWERGEVYKFFPSENDFVIVRSLSEMEA
jgi:hypothetical protein